MRSKRDEARTRYEQVGATFCNMRSSHAGVERLGDAVGEASYHNGAHSLYNKRPVDGEDGSRRSAPRLVARRIQDSARSERKQTHRSSRHDLGQKLDPEEQNECERVR